MVFVANGHLWKVTEDDQLLIKVYGFWHIVYSLEKND